MQRGVCEGFAQHRLRPSLPLPPSHLRAISIARMILRCAEIRRRISRVVALDWKSRLRAEVALPVVERRRVALE